MAERPEQTNYPSEWFNPNFVADISEESAASGASKEELYEQADAEEAAAAKARAEHPERVQAFLESRRKTIQEQFKASGGTLWHMQLAGPPDWEPEELFDAGVVPSVEAAARFSIGFVDGTPGLDLSGTGAGFGERARKVIPEASLNGPPPEGRQGLALKAMQAKDSAEGYYLAGYLAGAEEEDRQTRIPGTFGYAWRKTLEEAGGDVSLAAKLEPGMVKNALELYVGFGFESGTFHGLSAPIGDVTAISQVVANIRKEKTLPRSINVELAAMSKTLGSTKADPDKMFKTFVRAGEALRGTERDPLNPKNIEDTAVFAAGYATGQSIKKAVTATREVTVRRQPQQIH